jgi:perosamine synthetase
MEEFADIIAKIKSMYGKDKAFIPLHEPKFSGNEKKYVAECIDSTFVSSVGEFVNDFENKIKTITGSKHAVAVVNGTAALHLALLLAGVQKDDLVITQAISFVATANAIKYIGAEPFFIDIDQDSLGLSPHSLAEFLQQVKMENGIPIHQPSKKKVSAVVPMHTFGLPVKMDEILKLCNEFKIPVVEDAAESLGSKLNGKLTGTFGLLGVYSFNGNKIITSGGGGMIVTDDDRLGKLAKHMSTQSKIPHPWNFDHDMLGFNYRCPNINAALACAQLEQLDYFISNKRQTAQEYKVFFNQTSFKFIEEPKDAYSNYWLNAILMKDKEERDKFLQYANENGVMTRPVWRMLNKLPFLSSSNDIDLKNSQMIENRLVNIPSSVR